MNHAANLRRDGHGVGIDVQDVLQNAGVIGLWEYWIDENRVYSDRAMALFYGVDPESAAHGIPPQAFHGAIHPADLEMAIEMLSIAIDTGRSYRARYRVVDRKGHHRIVEVQAKAHQQDGRTYRLTGVNIEVEKNDRPSPAGDLLDQLAALAIEAFQTSERLGDRDANAMTRALLVHVGRRIARTLMSSAGRAN